MMMTSALPILILLILLVFSLHSFQLDSLGLAKRKLIHSLNLKDSQSENFGSRAIFNLAELFGRVASRPNFASQSDASNVNKESVNLTLEEIGQKIRKEYDEIFFATGNMDLSIWADNCTFKDPFSSFGGAGSRNRFKANADNFSKFLSDPKLSITSLSISEAEKKVSVGWIFSSTLNLPWKPVLAAAGETFHFIDDAGVIYNYEETWKSDPWQVVKRLFVPGK